MDDQSTKIVGLTTPKMNSQTKMKIIGAIIGVFVLVVGVGAGIYLVNQNQNPQEKAATLTYGRCDEPGSEACPGADGILRSCHPPEPDNTPVLSSCNIAGRVEFCGTSNYCCPVAGGTWTTDMSACTCDAVAPTSLTTDQISGSSAVLKWSGGTGGKFRVWVSKNNTPIANCGADSSTCPSKDISVLNTATQYNVTGLEANTTYYWTIMAWTMEGCDSGGQVVSFTTTSSGDVVQSSTPTATATSQPNLAATATSTATATSISSTATPTVRPTTTATATSVSQSVSTTNPTSAPIPVTGNKLPTILGASFGVIMVLVSIGLAL